MGQLDWGGYCPDAVHQAGALGSGRATQEFQATCALRKHNWPCVSHTLPSPDVPIPSISVKRWYKKIKKAGWHLPSQPLGRACWSAGADSALQRPGTTCRRLPVATSPHPQGSRGRGGRAVEPKAHGTHRLVRAPGSQLEAAFSFVW